MNIQLLDRLTGVATVRRASQLLVVALFVLGTAIYASPPAAAACGGTTTVFTEAELNDAIADFNGEGGPCVFTIEFGADIAINASTTPIANGTAGVELIIEGAGHELSANFSGTERRPLHIREGSVVTINDLLVGNGRALDAIGAPAIYNPAAGGGILVFEATLELNDSRLIGNRADGGGNSIPAAGGGLYAYDSFVTINRTTINFNEAVSLTNTQSLGGGLGADGGLVIINDSTIRQNEVRSNLLALGGGVGAGSIAAAPGLIGIYNSTFYQNEANANAGVENGAGFAAVGTAAELVHTTFVGNALAPTIGAYGPVLNIYNSLVSGNQLGDCNLAGGTFDAQHTYFEDSGAGACGLAAANPDGDGNIVGQGPADIGEYGPNSGPTDTIPLLPGSAAIDAGDVALSLDSADATLTSDQRGAPYLRNVGADVDMGAYEAQCPAFPRVVNTEAELTDAIACYNLQATPAEYTIELGSDIPITSELADINNPFAGVSLFIDGAFHTITDMNNDAVSVLDINQSDDGVAIDALAILNANFFAIETQEDLLLTRSTLAGGSSGLYVDDASAIVRDSAITGNSGTGIELFGQLRVINSTIAANNTGIQGVGSDFSEILLVQATVADHTFAGLDASVDTLTIANSVFGRNAEDCIFFGNNLLIEHTLLEDTDFGACGLAAANPDGDGNIVGEPALLGSLENGGGPTQTMPLLTLSGSVTGTSPALDAGDNALAVDQDSNPLANDQRGAGFPRILNSTVDMGAREGVASIVCPAFPISASNEAQLNTAIFCYNALTAAGVYTIELGADITLTGLPVAVNNPDPAISLIIEGNNRTIDGQDIPGVRPLTVAADTTVTLNNATLTGGNSTDLAQDNGGGLLNGGIMTLNNVTATGNYTPDDGGGLYNLEDGQMTIVDSTISDNTAGIFGLNDNTQEPGDGGGIGNDGLMVIRRSTISGNLATGGSGVNGGGIYNTEDGTLLIEDSTIDNNTAQGGQSRIRGGGIANEGSLTLSHSAVTNNTVEGGLVEENNDDYSGGGGISYLPDDFGGFTLLLIVVNSTISGNSATGPDEVYGGGVLAIRDFSEGGLFLVQTTISNNSVTATDQGGTAEGGGVALYEAGGQSPFGTVIANSILANSTTNGVSGGDCYRGFFDFFESFSTLYEDTGNGACGLPAANPDGDGNIVGLDPVLGPLQNNGGTTETHALLGGSPAIDSGDNAYASDPELTLTTDQRRFEPRINNGTVDRGAYETGATPPAGADVCPVDPVDGTVGDELTTLYGTGMGSPTRSRMVAKVTIPNADDVTELYGQMAAKEYNGVRYVRFIFGDKSYEQVQPETDLGQTAAISWWGADLTSDFQLQNKPFVKGRWFLQKGMKKMRLPRAIVFYATHDTGGEYANAWSTFTYPDNFVAGTTGFDQTNTNYLAIPETQATTDINVQLAVTDVNRDPRTVDVIVRAGGVEVTTTLTGPTTKQSELLNIFEVTLEDVPAGVAEVEIELVSVLDEGDSAALLGAAAHYACGEGEGVFFEPGTIVINKELNTPGQPDDWEFTWNGGSFTLPALGGTETLEDLPAGIYTFTELPQGQWEVEEISCELPVGSSARFNERSMTLILPSATTVECTFFNSLPQ